MKNQYCQTPGFCKMENITDTSWRMENSETSGIENAGRMLYNESTM